MFIVGGVKSIVSAVKSIVRPLTMDFFSAVLSVGIRQMDREYTFKDWGNCRACINLSSPVETYPLNQGQ